MSAQLTQHPLSAAFPAMQADEFDALVESIGVIGVQNPITLFEGMVIDGWHRYRAASDSGMACPSFELGDVDPRDFVIAQNKARRNLTALQRAAAVTSVYRWALPHREKKGETVSPLSKTNAELAAIASTTTRTIQQAKLAEKMGLTDAVKDGAITAREVVQMATGKPAKPPTSTKPTPVVEPEAEIPPDHTELDATKEALFVISEENDRLNDRLAIAAFDATEEERSAAHDTLIALRAENKTLTATLRAVTLSRDSLMEENAQMKRQMAMQRKEIDKLKNNK